MQPGGTREHDGITVVTVASGGPHHPVTAAPGVTGATVAAPDVAVPNVVVAAHAFPLPAAELRGGTDLVVPPSNWLLHKLPGGGVVPREMVVGDTTGVSTLTRPDMDRVRLSLSDFLGSVDYVAHAAHMKQLFMAPFSRLPLSLRVHRLLNTLLLEDGSDLPPAMAVLGRQGVRTLTDAPVGDGAAIVYDGEAGGGDASACGDGVVVPPLARPCSQAVGAGEVHVVTIHDASSTSGDDTDGEGGGRGDRQGWRGTSDRRRVGGSAGTSSTCLALPPTPTALDAGTDRDMSSKFMYASVLHAGCSRGATTPPAPSPPLPTKGTPTAGGAVVPLPVASSHLSPADTTAHLTLPAPMPIPSPLHQVQMSLLELAAQRPPSHAAAPHGLGVPASAGATTPTLRHVALHSLHGLTMVLGSDLLTFDWRGKALAKETGVGGASGQPAPVGMCSTPAGPSSSGAPVVRQMSLHLRPHAHRFSQWEVLEMYLDNVLAGVPELAVCYHDKGRVMGYSVMPAPDVLRLSNPPMPQTEVERNALSLLHFLREACDTDGHTYWLHRQDGDVAIRLVDLCTLTPPSRAHAARTPSSFSPLPTPAGESTPAAGSHPSPSDAMAHPSIDSKLHLVDLCIEHGAYLLRRMASATAQAAKPAHITTDGSGGGGPVHAHHVAGSPGSDAADPGLAAPTAAVAAVRLQKVHRRLLFDALAVLDTLTTSRDRGEVEEDPSSEVVERATAQRVALHRGLADSYMYTAQWLTANPVTARSTHGPAMAHPSPDTSGAADDDLEVCAVVAPSASPGPSTGTTTHVRQEVQRGGNGAGRRHRHQHRGKGGGKHAPVPASTTTPSVSADRLLTDGGGGAGANDGGDVAHQRARRASAIIHAWNSAAHHLLEVLRLQEGVMASARARDREGECSGGSDGQEAPNTALATLAADNAAIVGQACVQITAVAHQIVAAMLNLQSTNIDVCARVVMDTCAVLRKYASSSLEAVSDDAWAAGLPDLLRRPLLAAIGDVFVLTYRLHAMGVETTAPTLADHIQLRWISASRHVLALLGWVVHVNRVWGLPTPTPAPSAATLLSTLALPAASLPPLLSAWATAAPTVAAAQCGDTLSLAAVCYAAAIAETVPASTHPPTAAATLPPATMPQWTPTVYQQRLGDVLNLVGQVHASPTTFAPDAAARCFSLAVDLFTAAGDVDNALTARVNVSHVLRVTGSLAATSMVAEGDAGGAQPVAVVADCAALLSAPGGGVTLSPPPGLTGYTLSASAYTLLHKAATVLLACPTIIHAIDRHDHNPHLSPVTLRGLEAAGAAALLLGVKLSGHSCWSCLATHGGDGDGDDVPRHTWLDAAGAYLVYAARAYHAAGNGWQAAAAVYQLGQHAARVATSGHAPPGAPASNNVVRIMTRMEDETATDELSGWAWWPVPHVPNSTHTVTYATLALDVLRLAVLLLGGGGAATTVVAGAGCMEGGVGGLDLSRWCAAFPPCRMDPATALTAADDLFRVWGVVATTPALRVQEGVNTMTSTACGVLSTRPDDTGADGMGWVRALCADVAMACAVVGAGVRQDGEGRHSSTSLAIRDADVVARARRWMRDALTAAMRSGAATAAPGGDGHAHPSLALLKQAYAVALQPAWDGVGSANALACALWQCIRPAPPRP